MEHIVVPLASCFTYDTAELEKKCFSEPWSAVAIENTLNDGLTYGFAILDGQKLTGYALLQVLCDEGDILKIAVDPSSQRQGFGFALMRAMTDKARELGLKRLTLEVRASNSAAAALYQKSGFTVDGRRKDYYKNPVEDGILMSRSVD